MLSKLLIADDDSTMRAFLGEAARRLGREVRLAADGAEAIALLNQEPFDLVLTDHKMPRADGLAVLKAASQLNIPVIVMTAHGTVESAVEAMRLGAHNYLLKPFPPEALEAALLKADQHTALVRENAYLRASTQSDLIAESAPMKKLLRDLPKIAASNASVFITGESGTGKEVIAAALHRLSPRSTAPFIRVNCAAVPETLLESEFFGHEKGAFTGALARKIGRFELADHGTLLLDEVTEIPLALQPKLLRVLQEEEFERIGGTRPIHVDVRILATSNRNLLEAIESKLFRDDLYYRLNVIPLHIPPLRERADDILPLARHFLAHACAENHKPLKALTPSAIAKLLAYPWPGNVRELANIIERTVVLDFDPEIDAAHLSLETPAARPASRFLSLHELEKEHILTTLEAHNNNRTQTAEILGISPRTLRNKLHEYEVTDD